jgi:hypothetical protein
MIVFQVKLFKVLQVLLPYPMATFLLESGFFWCARHGALRASATSLAVVATLVTWR